MEALCKLGNGFSPCCQDGHDAKAAKRAGNTPPCEEEMLCESFDAREATGNGIKAFCQVGHGESDVGWVEEEELRRALECTLDNGDEGSREVGDEEMQGWVSPRISFSQDFVMEDMNALSQGGVPITVLPDGKKGEREKDNYSAEFEFLKNGAGYCVPDQAKSFMLSADELFFDGKLLPLPFSSIWAENEHMNLPFPDGEHHEETTLSALKSNNRAVSRHLSFDTPTPSSSSSSSSSSVLSSRAVLVSCSCPASPSRSSLVDQIPSISMPPLPSSSTQTWPPKLPPSSQPPAAPLSSLLPSLSCSMSSSLSSSSASLLSSSSTSLASLSSSSSLSKCSSKLKDLFRSKRSSIGTYPPSGDSSISSIRRPLITTRSFWPFSRSKSAGESKTTAPPPLPCRSNSAGETHSYTNVSISKECGDSEEVRLSTCSSVGDPEKQGPMAMMCQDDVHLAQAVGMLDVVSVEENRDCSTIEQSAKKTTSRADRTALKGSLAIMGSSSNMNGKKISGASVNVPKSSPGRRKGTSDGYGAKTHGERLCLRTWNAAVQKRKLAIEMGARKGLAGEVHTQLVQGCQSPLLNVAVYRGGNTSKMGLFGFGASKKEKKANEAALNWRNGA